MKEDLPKKVWWGYLEKDLQDLLSESFDLLEFAKSTESVYIDYSFVVFPAAKAYEGFLKKVFLDLKLISSDDYFGKRFRIGKALNPSLDVRFKEESVYEKLKNYCKGNTTADFLWETWKKSRNLIFHWFPNEKNILTLTEAEDRILMITKAMDLIFSECKF